MNEEKIEEKKTTIDSPLVFISHDTRDAEIAEEFSTLLKRVSAGVLKSFRSSDKKGNQGIEYGVEWYPEIIKNIQNASDVVCLLTPNSVDRPWILFEAGMAKGKLNTPILGISLGISLKNASTGPFAQFQNCSDDEDSLCKLVFQLVDRIPNSEPDNETIMFHVRKFKSKIDEIFKKRNENPESDEVVVYDDNSYVKLFEEIKVMFQDLPSRIAQNVSLDYQDRRLRKFHLMILEEPQDPKIGLLIGLSMLREKMPWIYDLGMDTIKVLESDLPEEEKISHYESFEHVVKYSIRHPIMREFMGETKEEYMLYREMPRIIIKNFRILIK